MEEIRLWLPALIAAASAVAVIATLRTQAKFSEWRHTRHEERLGVLEVADAAKTVRLAVIEDRITRTSQED